MECVSMISSAAILGLFWLSVPLLYFTPEYNTTECEECLLYALRRPWPKMHRSDTGQLILITEPERILTHILDC